MPTNQSTSNSNTAIPAWMSQSWHMIPTSGTVVSNSVSYNVTFDTSNPLDMTIALYGATWGHLDSSSVAAVASSSGAVTTITGSTIFGQPFSIDYSDGVLKCYMNDPSSQRRWLAVGLGVIAGTLLGWVTGFAAGSRLLGAAAGLIAATTGSLVTARGIPQRLPDPVQDGGSTPIWVANDGSKGGNREPGQGHGGQGTGPHPLKAVSA
ncbi:MAG TPA: hypothetical protein VIA62_17800 [Thermoanaerobaculia bacterium]|jgi:hypothetical protein|nr:hypothetical protein [Thermoanaerobaculia bacterium]